MLQKFTKILLVVGCWLIAFSLSAQVGITFGGAGSGVADSTRLVQDSILLYYQAGVEIGRDTIQPIGTGDKGEIDIINTLTDWRVDTSAIRTIQLGNGQVTLAKLDTLTADRVLVTNGSGRPVDGTLGGILGLSAGVLSAFETDGSVSNELDTLYASDGVALVNGDTIPVDSANSIPLAPPIDFGGVMASNVQTALAAIDSRLDTAINSQPSTQVVYGTGMGLTSNPHFRVSSNSVLNLGNRDTTSRVGGLDIRSTSGTSKYLINIQNGGFQTGQITIHESIENASTAYERPLLQFVASRYTANSFNNVAAVPGQMIGQLTWTAPGSFGGLHFMGIVHSASEVKLYLSADGGGIPSDTAVSYRLVEWRADTKKQINYGHLLFGTDNTLDIGANGATRPRTGYFGTSLASPLLIGGSTATSSLNLQTTTGVGTTGADMHFLVGSNGATEAMTILNIGNVGIGTDSPDKKFGLGDGDDEFSMSVASDKLTFWNDAVTPIVKATLDSLGVFNAVGGLEINGISTDALYWKINGQTVGANANIGPTDAFQFGIGTNGTARVYFDANGRFYSNSLTDVILTPSDSVKIFSALNGGITITSGFLREYDSLTIRRQLNLSNGTQAFNLVDNTTSALVWNGDDAKSYVNVTTTNGSELIALGSSGDVDTKIVGALQDADGDVGTSGQVLMSTATGTNWELNLSDGIYTPTVAMTAGTDTILNVYAFKYSRNDSIVTCSGRVRIGFESGTIINSFTITLPFASAFTDDNADASGTVNVTQSDALETGLSKKHTKINADSASDKIIVGLEPIGTTVIGFKRRNFIDVSFQYVVK